MMINCEYMEHMSIACISSDAARYVWRPICMRWRRIATRLPLAFQKSSFDVFSNNFPLSVRWLLIGMLTSESNFLAFSCWIEIDFQRSSPTFTAKLIQTTRQIFGRREKFSASYGFKLLISKGVADANLKFVVGTFPLPPGRDFGFCDTRLPRLQTRSAIVSWIINMLKEFPSQHDKKTFISVMEHGEQQATFTT